MALRGLHTLVVLAAVSRFAVTVPVSVHHGSIAYDELPSFLEADILPDKILPKMVMKDNYKLWPGGTLIFKLDYDVNANTYVTDIIQAAIDKINEVNCVKIVEAGSQAKDYVSIRLGQFYSSHVGKQGGVQNLTVVKDEIDIGSTMHELMHAFGFGHEHNRPDRDDYVTINFTNVEEEAQHYFTKYTPNSGYVGDEVEYDYTSIMHATNVFNQQVNVDMNLPVIWRNDGHAELGQRFKLTELDKKRLAVTYSCHICDSSEHDNLMFRYPGDCTKFYKCSNTIPYVMSCPAGLHFSTNHNYCDYPPLANCTSMSL
ncbi:zinc metalloproteinase nas-14-like [Homarus americanus]|uniref:zinc metalloproteinase nas-14-like n=1 Tax=Homarus americanus TaxID=6706 RepID=UPI001C44A3F7|nr:zinc metalloproteinase nas-14-like [Homarus americanus]